MRRFSRYFATAASLLLLGCQGKISPQQAGGLNVLIRSPDETVEASGPVAFRVEVQGGTPDFVELLKNDALLAQLPPSLEHTWDTAGEPQGRYAIQARASKAGRPYLSNSVTVVVSRASRGGGYALSTTPVVVQAGSSASVAIAIDRSGGYSGSIAFSLENPPDGVVGTFDPNPATGLESTLTLQVSSGVPARDYRPVVRGDGDAISKGVELPLSITSAEVDPLAE